MGTARVDLGDLAGLDDIQQSIDVAEAADPPMARLSGLREPRGVVFHARGRPAGARAASARGSITSTASGWRAGSSGTRPRSPSTCSCSAAGTSRSKFSMRRSPGWTAGAPHYQELQLRQTRARIRLGRGDRPRRARRHRARRRARPERERPPGVNAEPRRARHDPAPHVGRTSTEAVASIQEILPTLGEPRSGSAVGVVDRAGGDRPVSRRPRVEESSRSAVSELPCHWIEAARLWASGDLAGAADRFEEIGSAADEASARAEEAGAVDPRRGGEPRPSRSCRARSSSTVGWARPRSSREAETLLAPPA